MHSSVVIWILIVETFWELKATFKVIMLIKVKPAVLLLAVAFLLGTEGKSSGADSAACSKSNMLPLHGSQPQTTISPYNIEIHTNYYIPGGSVSSKL